MKALLIGVLILAGCGVKSSQPTMTPPPALYDCHRATAPVNLDGKLDDAAWKDIEWSSDFVDVRGDGWPKPGLRMRCKLLWDDQNLYIAAEMEDPDVWGTMDKDGMHYYEENNFEIFLDWQNNARDYWEFEMNPLNKVWTLQLNRPLGEGGGPIPGKTLAGVRTAVEVRGTLNNPADKDLGWTAEIAIPFSSLAADGHVPADGEHWRLFMSRIYWTLFKADGGYKKVPAGDSYWSWVPTGAIAFHHPEKYGELRFAR